MKALIIDDELDICYLLKGILKKKNFDTRCVSNISDAKVFLDKEHPSLIFLDNNLPDGLGLNFIPELKISHPEMKIVFITANDTNDVLQSAINRGADKFIGKPFNTDIINKTVECLIAEA